MVIQAELLFFSPSKNAGLSLNNYEAAVAESFSFSNSKSSECATKSSMTSQNTKDCGAVGYGAGLCRLSLLQD